MWLIKTFRPATPARMDAVTVVKMVDHPHAAVLLPLFILEGLQSLSYQIKHLHLFSLGKKTALQAHILFIMFAKQSVVFYLSYLAH